MNADFMITLEKCENQKYYKGPFILRVICRAMLCVISIKLNVIQLQYCGGVLMLRYSIFKHTPALLSHALTLR